jgi:cyclic beta-1,2-glucan synthetase
MELFRLLNPILRSADPDGVARYRVEPYVLAGDVYSVPPHVGRGGWTWYSGAAAWLYRAGIESLLGLKRRGDRLEVAPCLPPDWPGYRARLRCGGARYHIEASRNPGVSRGDVRIVFDGGETKERRFPFLDDGGEHRVDVQVGPADDRQSRIHPG